MHNGGDDIQYTNRIAIQSNLAPKCSEVKKVKKSNAVYSVIFNSAAEKKKERGPKDCSSSQEQKSEQKISIRKMNKKP